MLAEIILKKVRDLIANRVTVNVWPAQIAVEVTGGGDQGFEVQVTYLFEDRPAIGSILVLEAEGAWGVRGKVSLRGFRARSSDGNVQGFYWAFDTLPGDAHEVTFAFEWRPRVANQVQPICLSLPQALPTVMLADSDQPRRLPLLSFTDRTNGKIISCGELLESGLAAQSPNLMIAVAPQNEVGNAARNTVTLTSVTESVAPALLVQLDNLIGRARKHFGEILAIPADHHFGLVMPADLMGLSTIRPGTLVAIDRSYDPTDDADLLEIVSVVAGRWWGGGCRLHGEGWAEKEFALRTALALRWLQDIGDHARVERLVRFYEGVARKSIIRTTQEVLRGEIRSDVTAGAIGQIYQVIRTTAGLARLRQLTQKSWGMSSPAGQIEPGSLS